MPVQSRISSRVSSRATPGIQDECTAYRYTCKCSEQCIPTVPSRHALKTLRRRSLLKSSVDGYEERQKAGFAPIAEMPAAAYTSWTVMQCSHGRGVISSALWLLQLQWKNMKSRHLPSWTMVPLLCRFGPQLYLFGVARALRAFRRSFRNQRSIHKENRRRNPWLTTPCLLLSWRGWCGVEQRSTLCACPEEERTQLRRFHRRSSIHASCNPQRRTLHTPGLCLP